MIPTIEQVMRCYRIIAQTERMKTGRPGTETVANVLLGAESTTTGARPYPMGSNDNSLKCFRGSIAQVAAWRRTLSTEEIYRALGWPKTDIWRVGVQDGKAGPDYAGERPADGFDVDGTSWPLADGLAARQSVTFKFPLDAVASAPIRKSAWLGLSSLAVGIVKVFICVAPVVSPVCFQSRMSMHVSLRPLAIIAMSHQPFVQ